MDCNLYIAVLAFLILYVQCANETFVPTDEWQTIEEGIEIPAGLHVRINLKTGRKEAKLLKSENADNPSSLVSLEKKEGESISPEALKEMLKNIKDENPNGEQSSGKKFRSYEEIKSELSSQDVGVKTDLELMKYLMDKYRSVKNETATFENPQAQLEIIVQSLEYLVHQYDNALEFAQMKGFQDMIVPCLNGSADSPTLRLAHLALLGAAVQNNPRVQKMAADAGTIQIVLRVIAHDESNAVRARALFALSCLLRQFPVGQACFLNQGGLPLLAAAFDDNKHPSTKVLFKISNLVTDLLREVHEANLPDNQVFKAAYEPVTQLLNIREGGWCARASKWFLSVTSEAGEVDELDHSMVEAAADLLTELAAGDCLSDLIIDLRLVSGINLSRQFYSELVLQDLDDGEVDSYFSAILDKLNTLAAILARTTKYKMEL